MSNFTWQHIKFEDNSNPYICMKEENFKYIQSKYNLEKIKENYWMAKTMNKQNDDSIFGKEIIEMYFRNTNDSHLYARRTRFVRCGM